MLLPRVLVVIVEFYYMTTSYMTTDFFSDSSSRGITTLERKSSENLFFFFFFFFFFFLKEGSRSRVNLVGGSRRLEKRKHFFSGASRERGRVTRSCRPSLVGQARARCRSCHPRAPRAGAHTRDALVGDFQTPPPTRPFQALHRPLIDRFPPMFSFCLTFLGDFDPGQSDSRSLGQT